MSKKKAYGSIDVEQLDVLKLIPLLTVGCIVAIDVAKTKFMAAIATAAGEVLKLVRFEHPTQTGAFLRLLVTLRDAGLAPKVVMEPTGTYGDAIRYQCHQRQLDVHMMPPKYTRDFAEVMDGTPGMHDAKSSVVLAKLQAIKPARVWQPESDARRNLRALVDERVPIRRVLSMYRGHLEAVTSRHWPELQTHIDLSHTRSWMSLLMEFPGPRLLAAEREQAGERLRKASRGHFGAQRIRDVLDSAESTLGVPMTPGEQTRLGAIVEQIHAQTQRLDAVDARIAEAVAADVVMARIAVVVGPVCAATLMSHVGSPTGFANAKALEKAMGLNLVEDSSGESSSPMRISKRGSGEVRHLMYLAALRLLKENTVVGAWYRGRAAYAGKVKLKAVVAVMRKLARALYHVARGETFDAKKLFDVRRLDLTDNASGTTVASKNSHTAQPRKLRSEGGEVQQTV